MSELLLPLRVLQGVLALLVLSLSSYGMSMKAFLLLSIRLLEAYHQNSRELVQRRDVDCLPERSELLNFHKRLHVSCNHIS